MKQDILFKKLLLLLIFLFNFSILQAQIFWTETFNNGCTNACTANGVNTGNGAWTIDDSNNPTLDNCGETPQHNVWYVSCKENGNASGTCGTGCGSNATLHIGSTTAGDLGASFDAGGYCDVLGGGWGGGTNTNTMVYSPAISTLGKTNITLSFNYLHFGELGSDWGWVDYSINNGSTWVTLQNPLPQVTCCGGPCNNSFQGRWATFTTTLPVGAENIAGFRLRFGWRNDDDMSGYDPSIAINDITLSTPASPAPVANFSASSTSICVGSCINFTDLSTNTPTSWSWTFSGGTPGTSTAQNPTNICYNTAGTYAVTLIATNGFGSDTEIKNGYITVTAYPSITVSPSAPSYCPGGSVILTASGASSFSWAPATGLSGTTGATVTANPGSTTTYTVTGTTAGCTGTTTVTVTVNTNPVVSVTPSAPSYCPGGSVILTASGASSFSWAPATGLSGTTGATVTANPGSTTTYTVTGTTAGCTGTTTVTVTVNTNPVVSVTPSAPSYCPGGSVILTASGASSFSWAPATGLSGTTGATVTANPGSTTTYTVTGTTAGCTGTTTVTVTVNTNPVVSVTPSAPSYCPGGSVILTASGASSFSWAPATGLSGTTGATVTANPGSTTTYTVTGTTAGCTGTTTVTVTVNTNPVVSVTPSAPSYCPGGSVILTASGASSFSWAPATGLSGTTGATVTANPGSTTTYTVTGTTAGCTGTTTVTVTVNTNPVVSVTPSAPSYCPGGSVILTASGASSFSWAPATGLSGTTGATVTANPGSTTTYTVTGTTAGCTGTTTVTVTVNTNPVVSVTPSAPSYCPGGSVILTASGASSFSWAPATGLSGTTGATVTANPGSTTTYTVTGTTAGCTGTTTVTVTVNTNPVVSVTPSAPSYCPGGSVILTASGASSFSWAPATGLSGTTGATVTANPGSTTTYTVTGTTAGCTGSTTVVVTVDSNPTITVTPSAPSYCTGGSVILTASGANTYDWAPATGLSSTTGTTVTANPTTTTTYTVTGTGVGCTGTTTVVVTVNPIPSISVTPATPSYCTGDSVSLTASGATTYSWAPATGLSSTVGANVTASPTSTTTYTVTGTAGGCDGSNTVTVTVNSIPVVTISPNPVSLCPGSSDTLTASGASTYSWSPASGLNTTTGAIVIASPTSNTIYTVIGSTMGCSDTLTVTVTLAAPLIVTPSSDTICLGDSTQLSASGGTIYTWTPVTGLSSTNTATVTASPTVTTTYYCSSPCGSSNLIFNGDFELGNTGFTTDYLLCAVPGSCGSGDYIVANNAGAHHTGWTCTDHTSGTGNFLILDGSTTSGTNVWCQTVAVTPGTNYTFSCWASTMTNWWNLNPADLHFLLNGVDIGNIVTPLNPVCGWNQFVGSWNSGISTSVNICIVDNCVEFGGNDFAIDDVSLMGPASVVTDSATVVVVNIPIANAGPDDTICNGSNIQLNATGGTTYSWSPATGLSCTSCNNPIADPSATTSYTVTVSNGSCSDVDSLLITVNPAIIANAGSDATICLGDSVQLNATGGTSYSWNPATGLSCTNCNNPYANPSSTTTYYVTVTDAGCSDIDTVIVNVGPGVTANAGPDVSICVGDSTQLNASGGTGYSWSPTTGLSCTNCANPIAQPSTTTTYTVTVSSGSCLPGTDQVTVTITPPPTANINASDTSICSGQSVTLTASGGNTYLWSTSETTTTISVNPSVSMNYSVTVSNGGECTDDATIHINVNPLPSVTAYSDTTIDIGTSVHLNASGALSYTWYPPNNLSCTNCPDPFANPLVTTIYYLTGVDANGCSNTDTIVIIVKTDCGDIYVPNAFSPNDDGINDVLYVHGNCIKFMEFSIYDRWGEKVFFSNDPKIGWNGKYHGTLMNSGVFVYFLRASLIDKSEIKKQGNISLFR